MITIEQARECVGRSVTYARRDDPTDPTRITAGPELGTITSVNERYVFVRYGSDRGSKGTNPGDLTLH